MEFFNPIPKCPNCFYSLVLLEHRRKYKCPKCSRLYYQKEIDDREFVAWNKRERQRDSESLTEKKGKQKVLTDFEKKQKRKEYYRAWKEKNPDSYIRHYRIHKETILERQKEYRIKNEQLLKDKRKNKKLQNIDDFNRLERIKYWRHRQKELAQQFFEFEVIKTYKDEIDESLPTNSLSYLLKSQHLKVPFLFKF
jgi:predicted RNA-binding Zn-ribbon protein involved in translation (DUF1610 family)